MSDTDEEPEQKTDDLNFHTDMPVGEILRRTRVHYGQSLFQIESVLRIRASQLEALEKGDISQLPGRVYAIGFVRSYSEYLGLDGDKMVHLFKEQSVGRKSRPDLSFPVPASESKAPSLFVIGGSLFGFAVLVSFIAFVMFPQKEKSRIASVPEPLTKSRLDQAPALVGEALPAPAVSAPTSEPAKEPEPPSSKNRIVLEVTDASWVEIVKPDGTAILRQVLKPGDIYLVPDEPGLVLGTGNAGGISVKIDGKEGFPLGDLGQIKRKVILDPATLKKPNASKTP